MLSQLGQERVGYDLLAGPRHDVRLADERLGDGGDDVGLAASIEEPSALDGGGVQAVLLELGQHLDPQVAALGAEIGRWWEPLRRRHCRS